MKDNIEKSLKRFLKRKAKITMGFITAFLITGSVGYALTITEDQVKDNTWTNESKIEEQIEVSESLLYKRVNISNKGEIIANEEITDKNPTGNGINIFFEQKNEINFKLGNIINNGIISGNIVTKKLNDGYFNGNGINFNIDSEETNTGNITNTGTISGNLDGKVVGTEVYSGNGINFIFTNLNSTNIVGNITNSGIISGNVEGDVIEGVLGNGIMFLGDTKNITIGNIINSGNIKGNLSEGSRTNDLQYTTNGIFAINENINIGDIINSGTISGKSEINIEEEPSFYGHNQYISNGINLAGILKLKNITNTGIISGESKGNINKSGFIGNGIGLFCCGDTFIGKINNNGTISGNIIGNIIDEGQIGNGFTIRLEENPEDSSIINRINNITNNGIISGNIQGDIEDVILSGNGIVIEIAEDNLMLDITNNGVISGNITGNISEDSKTVGNGVAFIEYDNICPLKKIENDGIIIGNNYGINISKNDKLGELTNYSNAGIVAGKTPVFAEGFTDDLVKSADKGVAIKLDDKGNIASITNGNGGEVNGKKVINADIIDKDSSISVDKETNYANNIINGAGVNSATLNVNAKTSVTDSIINAFATALKVNDSKEFSASNTTFNGGGLDGNTAVITDEGNSTISLDKSTINGNIALGSGDSKLAVTNSQINGDIAGGEGNDNLTIGGSSLYNKIDGFEDITFKGDTTLYETAKVAGANRIEIDGGTEVNLRVDSTKKADDGTYKEHALFNSSDKLLTLAGNTNAIGKDDVDKDGNLNVEENEGRVNYDKVSILNLVTSGLGLKSKIDLGNTKVDDTLWVKTDSILTQATKEENDKGTILNIEAEKDLFSINKKFDNPEPDKPVDPDKPVNPDKPVDPKPDKPVDPDVDPDKPIDPKPEPDKPQHSIKYYTKLNDIYKGIYSSNDKNFNALNDIVVNYTFSDKDKGNYPIIGNDKAQMETLLGYLTSVYTQNPYAFSNQATRKAMNLFHDSVRDNNFKANNDEWLIYGGLLHQSGDQEQTYYGRNYHGFDTGNADVDADIKLTGAYGQFEYGLSDSLATGIMVGGSKSEIEVESSKVKGTGAYVGAYAKKDINNFRFTTGLGYQYSEYDGDRRTINETYSSDYQDQAINLYVDGKYSHNLGNNLFLEPKAGLSYTHIDQDSIKENDKALALDIEAKDFDVLEGTVGVDIKKVIPTEKGTHTLTAGISYNHILDGANADSLRANYGGSKFDVLVPHKNKGQVSLGAKYEVELENGMFYDVKGNYYVPTDSKENSNKNADKGEWRVGVGFGYKF